MNKTPTLFVGAKASDQRGSVSFVNDFSFKKVKRFYIVENANTKVIRAFHGHMKEAKYVFVAKGKILFCAVSLTNKKTPSKKASVKKFILSDNDPSVLYIPPKYANGFKALTKTTKVFFFSTSSLEDSLKDDYRFPHDYWGKDVWQTKK